MGYIHVKIVPSTNHVADTLTVEHTDADITDAQAKVRSFCDAGIYKICLSDVIGFAMAKEKGGGGGCFTQWIQQQPLLGAGLCCTAGLDGKSGWIPKANQECRHSSPC